MTKVFEPLFDQILVKPDPTVDITTDGGIIIPGTINEAKTCTGFVVAIGAGRISMPDKNTIPMTVQVGDHIMYNDYAGQSRTLEGEDTLLMREGECIGRWVEKKDNE